MQNHIDFLSNFIYDIENGSVEEKWSELRGDVLYETIWFSPRKGICDILSQLSIVLRSEFNNFLIKKGLCTVFPVAGEGEYNDNNILWWPDEESGSYPSWQKRIALLKEFIQYLEGKKK